MALTNDMLEIAKRDLKLSEMILGTSNDEIMQNMAAYHTHQSIEKIIKQLMVDKIGHSSIEHDLGKLIKDAQKNGVLIPEWVDENSYEVCHLY